MSMRQNDEQFRWDEEGGRFSHPDVQARAETLATLLRLSTPLIGWFREWPDATRTLVLKPERREEVDGCLGQLRTIMEDRSAALPPGGRIVGGRVALEMFQTFARLLKI